MIRDSPLWAAPRIHGELLKRGIEIGETSVEASTWYARRKPPFQTRRTCLENQGKTVVPVDFVTVLTIRFRSGTWFCLTTEGQSRISMSLPILRPNGPRNNCGRLPL